MFQACIKIAWDAYQVEDLPRYVKVWKDILSKYLSPSKDYQGLQTILEKAVLKWRDDVYQKSLGQDS